MFTLTDPKPPSHCKFPSQERIVAIFDNGIGLLTASSVALVAGGSFLFVDQRVEELTRAVLVQEEYTEAASGVLKLVPTIKRKDRLGLWDVLASLRRDHHRIRGQVIASSEPDHEAQIAAVVAFVRDCVHAWAYDPSSSSRGVVIVELDDFCEHVGVTRVGIVMDELRLIASQFTIAILAIAHSAGDQLLAAAFDAVRSPAAHSVKAGRSKRARVPHARELIRELLPSAAPGRSPRELARSMFGPDATIQENARIRKNLQNMKDRGDVVSNGGRYWISDPSISPIHPIVKNGAGSRAKDREV